MLFLRIVEVAIAAIGIMFVIQQVVLPLARGTLLFPLFRDEGKLEDELAKQNQAKREAMLRKQLKPDKKATK